MKAGMETTGRAGTEGNSSIKAAGTSNRDVVLGALSGQDVLHRRQDGKGEIAAGGILNDAYKARIPVGGSDRDGKICIAPGTQIRVRVDREGDVAAADAGLIGDVNPREFCCNRPGAGWHRAYPKRGISTSVRDKDFLRVRRKTVGERTDVCMGERDDEQESGENCG